MPILNTEYKSVSAIDVIYSGVNGKILHNKNNEEIEIIPTNGTAITIADKDVGATTAGTTSASRGNWYVFSSIPTAPTGYHNPTKTEWENLITLWESITGSNSDDLIMKHLLLPGAGYKNSSDVQSDIGAGLYWSTTSVSSTTAYGTRFYPSSTFQDMFAHSKSNKLCVRVFKD